MTQKENTQRRRRPTQRNATSNQPKQQDEVKRKRGRPRKNADEEEENNTVDFNDRDSLRELFVEKLAELLDDDLRNDPFVIASYIDNMPLSQKEIQQSYIELCQYVIRNNLAYRFRANVFKIVRKNNEEFALFHENKPVDVLVDGEYKHTTKNWLSRYSKSDFANACTTFFPVSRLLYPTRTGRNNLEIAYISKSYGEVLAEAEGIRKLNGISFRPGIPRKITDSTFNIWTAWGCQPYAGDDYAEHCKLIVKHCRDVVCNGNKEKFDFLMTFLAHTIQFPYEPATKSLVLLSGEGTGKNTLLTNVMQQIVGADHYFESTNKNDFVGEFNAHLEGALFAVANEAFFIGDAQANDRLKGQITAEKIKVNEKYARAYDIENCARVIIISNHDQAVKISTDNRRYVVFDLNERYKDDPSYFDPLYAEINSQGVEAFFRYLKEYKVDRSVIRKVLDDDTMRNQKIKSLSTLDQFFLNMLDIADFRSRKVLEYTRTRIITDGATELSWLKVGGIQRIPTEVLYEAYDDFARTQRAKYIATKTDFQESFEKIFRKAFCAESVRSYHKNSSFKVRLRCDEIEAGAGAKNATGVKSQMQCYVVSDIHNMRHCFDEYVSFPQKWGSVSVEENDDFAPFEPDNIVHFPTLNDAPDDDIPFDMPAPFDATGSDDPPF